MGEWEREYKREWALMPGEMSKWSDSCNKSSSRSCGQRYSTKKPPAPSFAWNNYFLRAQPPQATPLHGPTPAPVPVHALPPSKDTPARICRRCDFNFEIYANSSLRNCKAIEKMKVRMSIKKSGGKLIAWLDRYPVVNSSLYFHSLLVR